MLAEVRGGDILVRVIFCRNAGTFAVNGASGKRLAVANTAISFRMCLRGLSFALYVIPHDIEIKRVIA
ncbi:hypothetical protein CPI84_00680 [Erwinia pyrifoliae]|nr:hypothetical protein CPI84_00680 [Erwinia pyrifoliae]